MTSCRGLNGGRGTRRNGSSEWFRLNFTFLSVKRMKSATKKGGGDNQLSQPHCLFLTHWVSTTSFFDVVEKKNSVFFIFEFPKLAFKIIFGGSGET